MNVSANTTIALSTNTTHGIFYPNAGCGGGAITSILMSGSTSAVTFYYRNDTAEAATITTADSTGAPAMTSATRTVTTSPAGTANLLVAGYPNPASAGTSASVTVTARAHTGTRHLLTLEQ